MHELREQIMEELQIIRPDSDFQNSTDYFADHLLDSFDLIRLTEALNARFGIEIDLDDIIPEHFFSADAISSLVRKYRSAS